MLEVIAAAGLVLAGSALCGSALRRLTGLASRNPAAPAVGFAMALALAAVAIRTPGRAITSTVVLVLAVGASAGYLWRTRSGAVLAPWTLITALIVVLLAMLPFLVSGHIGLLGVGTNDDTAEHLLAAWTLQGPLALGSNKLIASGYPIGPHALAATIANATGMPVERAFTGVIVAVPALLALAACALMREGPRVLRGATAAAVGLCYLQAAFLVQGSFKEPMEAVVLLAFVAGLYELERTRATSRLRAVPLGLLAAGSVYIYSYAGVLWLGGTLLLWSAAMLIAHRRWRDELRSRVRTAASPVAIAVAAFLAMIAPEIPRIVRFLHSGYNHESSTVYGDLLHRLPPLEALGVWLRLDFRFDIPLASFGGVVALLALAAVIGSLIRCLRRADFALPSAVIVAAGLFGLSATGSPYTAAKGLVVLAPCVTLLLGREMLLLVRAAHGVRSWSAAGAALLATVFAVGAYSDLEVLRDGPVGPTSHSEQLSAFRAIIRHRPTLFLGADDFIHWELRGANLATPPAPLYTRTIVPLRRTKAQQDRSVYESAHGALTTNRFAGLGLAFDFDSVPSQVLDRFDFVILPRSSYSSTAPSNWRLVSMTRSYELWRRAGSTPAHQTLLEVDNPGAILDCSTPAGRAIASRRGVAMVRPAPIIGERGYWKGPVGYAGQSAHQYVHLGSGRWDVSLQYDSSVNVTVSGPGLRAVLPANLEPLGPYWFAGTMRKRRPGWTRIVVTYNRLSALGRMIGALGLTRAPAPTGLRPLGRVVVTRSPSRDHPIPLKRGCGQYVDWYTTS